MPKHDLVSRLQHTWRRIALRALAALGIALAPWACAAQALPAEVHVGTAAIVDPEYDAARDGVYCPACNFGAGDSRLAYIDKEGRLWVGYVDFETGNFLPKDGRAVLVDASAVAPIQIGNGPEWMASARGSEIIYTRFIDGEPKRPGSLNLGFARPGNGGWIAGSVDDTRTMVMPIGTSDPADEVPAVHYQNAAFGDMTARIYWREVSGEPNETRLPYGSNDPAMTRRWIPGTRDILITAPALHPDSGNVYKQVFRYSTVTNTIKQLTFDPVNKLWAFMWSAPEHRNAEVFFVLSGGTKIDIYKEHPRDNGGTFWNVVHSIGMPADTPYVSSPEVFVHNGKSWIFFTLSSNPDLHDFNFPATLVAMVGIDPADPEIRRLTAENDPPRSRRDPEYFITANGPYIYYNRYLLGTPDTPQANEGIFRVDTGLGPRIP